MNQITSSLKLSVKLLKEYKFRIAIPALVDMLFFFVYGFVFSLIFNRIGNYLMELYNLVMRSPEEVQGSLLSQGLFGALRATPELSQLFNRVIIWLFLLAIAVYIVYSAFQGLSWKLSYGIAGRKISYPRFLVQFFSVNLFWLVFYIIYQIIAYLLELRAMISINISQTPAPSLSLVLWLYLLVLAYFMLISYSLIGRYKPLKIIANSFRLGFSKAKTLFPSYLLILVVFFILNFILILSLRISPTLMFIIGVITVFPAMTLARVFFNLVISKIA